MTSIQSILASFQQENARKSSQSEGNGGFDSLLSGLTAPQAISTIKPSEASNSDQIDSFIQQLYSQTTDMLLALGSDKTEVNGVSSTQASHPFADSGEGFITGDGPLPAFLAQLDQRYGLDASQQKALRDITMQFRDTDGSPDMVAKLGEALAAAGIGTKPPAQA